MIINPTNSNIKLPDKTVVASVSIINESDITPFDDNLHAQSVSSVDTEAVVNEAHFVKIAQALVVQEPKWGPGNVWEYKVLWLILIL